MSGLENYTNHYYHIESKNRLFGDEVNFQVSPHRFNHVKSFKMKEIQMTYSFYPINSNNNTIVIQKDGDGTDRTITLTPGEYNLIQFKTELKAKLDGSGGPAHTYTITDNDVTHKLTITQNSGTFIYRGTISTANKLLGFDNTDTTALIAHTSVNVFDISGTHFVKVYSNTLTKFDTRIRNSSGTANNLLCIIPLSSYSFGEIIHYTPRNYIYDYHPEDESNIDIELRDEDDKVLGGTNKLNGQDFYMFLQFHTNSSNNPNIYNRINSRQSIYNSKNF